MVFETQYLESASIQLIDGDRGSNYPKQEHFKTSGHCLFLSAKNVTSSGFAFEERVFIDGNRDALLRAGKLQRGDVVLTTRGTIGNVAFYSDDIAFDHVRINSGMMILRAHPAVWNRRFLYFLFASSYVQEQISALTSGSAVPQLPARDLKKFKLPVIKKEIQDAIDKVVGGISDKIDLNHRINQTLEAMAQAIFKSWFVDFDPVKAKIAAKQEGRDPLRAALSAISGKLDAELDALLPEQYAQLAATAALFPDEMKESELGDIPRGWSVSKVEKLLSRLSAKARYIKEEVSAYGQIPVFEQGASILLGYHNGVASYPASAESPMFIFGDHTCVTRLSFQPFDISQNVIPLQGKDRATAWVYYAIKEKQKFQEYRRHWMELISKDVVIATADICLEFSKRMTKLHLQIEANERQMQSLRELRDTLLPKLLSGELSVLEAAAEAEA
jgi:type I restriction enzyme S subunit